MLKNKICGIIFLILLFIVFSQSPCTANITVPAEQWNTSFGGDAEDSSWSVQQTSDGGYIVAGVTYSHGKGSKGYPDAWLVKFDKNGDMQWNKTFGGTYFDEGYFVRQVSDGGYVLSGYTFPSGYAEPWLIKTDSDGNEIWNKTSDEISHEDFLQYLAERSSDGGYVIGDTVEREIGSYYDVLMVESDLRLTKYDSNGNRQWNNTFGKNDTSETFGSPFNYVRQTPDGGYILAGTIYLNETTGHDIWLIKTNDVGQEQWNMTYGGQMDDSALCVWLTSDSGYVLTGMYNDSWSFAREGSAFILKTDAEGNQEWMKEFSNCTLYSVQQTSDNGYVATGIKGMNAFLLKLEGDGDDIEEMEHSEKSFKQILGYFHKITHGLFHWN